MSPGGRDRAGRFELPTPSAGSLLLAILGYCLEPGEDELQTQTLIEALDVFGVVEKTARQTIRRMVADGLLRTEREGRTTRLVLTARMRERLHSLDIQADRFRAVYYSNLRGEEQPQDWLVLALSAESLSPDVKQRVRRELVALGWGSVFPGVWLNCSATALPAAQDLLLRSGLDKSAAVIQANFLAPTNVQELIARGWDLNRLAHRYQTFIDRFDDVLPATDLEAFRQRTLIICAWSAFTADPLLPPAFLEPDWPGPEAHALIADRYVLWAGPARRWWAGVHSSSSAS